MSIQDKLERILKEIHIVLAEGESISGEEDKVLVDKKDVLKILEKLNLTVYEMMDQYEVTSQSRELAQRRSEKKGEELVAKIEQQTEDVYAASLIYTEDAMNRVAHLIGNALSSSKQIFEELHAEIEKEQYKVKEDQLELREQLQDFKDARKYLMILEECNKEREKEQQDKDGMASERCIQNEAKHYAMSEAPQIKVNQAYFQRRDSLKESEEKSFDMPDIKVDLDAEYFKWQEEEAVGKNGDTRTKESTPKRRFLFGKMNRREHE